MTANTTPNPVDALRREVRRLKAGFLAILVALAALAAGHVRAAAVAGELEARRFVLSDEHGATRAVLEVERGSARLVLYREDGSKALSLSDKAEVWPAR